MDSESGPKPSTSTSEVTTSDSSSAFERWRNWASETTGIGLTTGAPSTSRQSRDITRCEKNKQWLIDNSPIVTFMLQHLALSGCRVPARNLICGPCNQTRAGGYDPERGAIILCASNFYSRRHMERTMAHELVHMYDDCKFNVDWRVQEIRANSLSGDCRYASELARGVFGIAGQHQECVRRRAIGSLAANPLCPNEETARKVVNEVFESCFKDTRPFDEVY
ncbi:peptidase M76 family-domain-containing protein [Armillaria novae-zelandiae]|uniref:Mitochondrial inner membrane protease ATP23 n=1 Tax=Armillaria novae-zelandiae TaxID=153914 RepID=A0AA39U6T0_9AGAR|nr:peptidase M76 family-domain-containing protein [Armillaria novae-zelandiae]